MATCSSVFGVLIVLLVFGAGALSFGLPFWVQGTDFSAGLWQECQFNQCTFIALNATELPSWFNPVRVVNAVSLVSTLVAMLAAVCYLACQGCTYSIRAVQFIIMVLVLGGLELTYVVVTYAMEYDDTAYFTYHVPDDLHLGWCFYLAAGAVAGFLVALVCFVCETSNARARNQYEPIRPTTYA